MALVACVESKTYRSSDPTVPTVPQLRLPQNDAYEGSTVLGRLQPTFVWEPSTVELGAVTSYEIQYSPDKSFSADVMATQVASTSHQPAKALQVSTVPPVGRRYYWRVRACSGELCSEFSKPWWVNVGRSAKDFNGDGFDDVVVGAFAPPASSHQLGKVYVYLGGAGGAFEAQPDVVTYDDLAASRVGFSVSSAGDFNGDGFADVLIGAPGRDYSGDASGVAYMLLGSAAFDNLVDVYFLGSAAGEQLGTSVAAAGDVNADGYSDVIVGAPGGPGTERAYVYWGGPVAPYIAEARTALVVPGGGSFGADVSGAGDVNGDGYSDVLVGAASTFDEDRQENCTSHVYLGSEQFNGVSAAQISGAAGEKCSLRTKGAGDVNADGFSDMVARSRLRSEGLRLFLGGRELPKAPDVVLSLANGRLCRDASGVGDVNGDGADDVAMTDWDPALNSKVIIFLGKAGARDHSISETPAASIVGSQIAFGRVVTGVGDLNADGYGDFAVGENTTEPGPGRALVYFGNGGASIEGTEEAILSDGGNGNFFGMAVAALEGAKRSQRNTGVHVPGATRSAAKSSTGRRAFR